MKQFQEQFKEAKTNYLNRFEKEERISAARYFDIETAWMNSALVSDTKLRSCDPISLRKCIANVVTAGLTLSPVMKFCYLIPRRIQGKMEATLEISYMGLIKMMTDSGSVAKMEAHIIYRNDELDYQLGSNETFIHKPTLENRGEMLAVYAEAHIRGGFVQREILTKDDIKEIKKKSQATTGPWIDFEGEMWRKSAIKRLFKYLPKTEMSDELIAALSIEYRNDTTMLTADDISPEVAAEIFTDIEAEVLEDTPGTKAEQKPKAKRGRPAKTVVKAEPIVEDKAEPAVEAKDEPIVEAKEEPIVEVKEKPPVEAGNLKFKETKGQEFLKVEYNEGPEISNNTSPKGASIINSSLTDLMHKLT